MLKLKDIESKYRYSFNNDLVPFEYIKDSIKEVSGDISHIGRIKLQNKDKEILELCDKLHKKLCDILDYFEKKYANIKHLNKSEEKDNFVNYYTNQFDVHFKVS